MRLHTLIALKAKYHTIYYTEYDSRQFICREPTLAEVIAQHAVARAFGLDELSMYKELAKVTMVEPANPDFENEQSENYVPEEVLVELADQIAVDVPYNDEELSSRAAQRLKDLVKPTVDIETMATELWLATNAQNRLDIFTSLPVSVQIDMMALKLLTSKLQTLSPEEIKEFAESLGIDPAALGIDESTAPRQPVPRAASTPSSGLMQSDGENYVIKVPAKPLDEERQKKLAEAIQNFESMLINEPQGAGGVPKDDNAKAPLKHDKT